MTLPWTNALDEDMPIALSCDTCGHETLKPASWLRRDRASFVCAGCGQTVAVDSDVREAKSKELAEIGYSFYDAFADVMSGLNGTSSR